MARYWVGHTANWSATSSWSTTSGGASGAAVPTASDDVFFDANSFSGASQVVTIDVAATCNNMNWTGATNTPTIAGSQTLTISGSLTFISAMLCTATGTWTFNASTTGHTVAFAGVSFPMVLTFNDGGFGGGWTLQDGLLSTNTGGTALGVSGGSVDFGTGLTHQFSGGFSVSVAVPATVSFHNCLFISSRVGTNFLFYAPNTIAPNPLTIAPNTAVFRSTSSNSGGLSQITIGGYPVDMNGASLEWKPVTGGTFTIAGKFAWTWQSFTVVAVSGSILTHDTNAVAFNVVGTITLTGVAIGTRLYFHSATRGVSSGVYTAGLWANSNVDFEDIVTSGSGMANTDATGDLGGNSGTFVGRTPQTLWWIGDTGSWSQTAHWSTTNGGSTAGTIPLPQDTARFGSSSFSAGSKVVTFDVVRIGAEDWTGATNTPARTLSVAFNSYGSLTLISAMTLAGNFIQTMAGRAACTIMSAGRVLPGGLTIDCITGSVTQLDALTVGTSATIGIWTLTSGTYSTGGFALLVATLISNGAVTRALNLGSSIITVRSTTAICLDFGAGVTAGITLNPGTSLILITGTGVHTLQLGGLPFYDILISATGGSAVTLKGGAVGTPSKLHSLRPGPAARTFVLTANNPITFTAPDGFPSGRAGAVVTITGASGAIVGAGGFLQVCDYLSLANVVADVPGLWYAGAHSTDGGGNSNWLFTAHRHGSAGRVAVAPGARSALAQGVRTVVAPGIRTAVPA